MFEFTHTCPKCTFTFKNPSIGMNHYHRTHTSNPTPIKHQCSICGFRTQNLRRHEYSKHLKVRFTCIICGNRFSRLHEHDKHIQRCHVNKCGNCLSCRRIKEKHLKCELCDAVYLTIQKKLDHMEKKHNGQRVQLFEVNVTYNILPSSPPPPPPPPPPMPLDEIIYNLLPSSPLPLPPPSPITPPEMSPSQPQPPPPPLNDLLDDQDSMDLTDLPDFNLDCDEQLFDLNVSLNDFIF